MCVYIYKAMQTPPPWTSLIFRAMHGSPPAALRYVTCSECRSSTCPAGRMINACKVL